MADALLDTVGWGPLLAAFVIMTLAGVIKGAVGFALPLIAVGGIGSVMSARMAITAVILPILITNLLQATRGGLGGARDCLRRFGRLFVMMGAVIALVAQIAVHLPDWVLFVTLGTGVTVFSVLQLSRWRPVVQPHQVFAVEILIALLCGLFGGLAGVWGPPLVLYFLALNLPRAVQIQTLGLAFLIGSVVLSAAHLHSGMLNAQTLPFSAMMVLPALLGMWAGQWFGRGLDPEKFRRMTLWVLVFAGLNLLRRGVM